MIVAMWPSVDLGAAQTKAETTENETTLYFKGGRPMQYFLFPLKLNPCYRIDETVNSANSCRMFQSEYLPTVTVPPKSLLLLAEYSS